MFMTVSGQAAALSPFLGKKRLLLLFSKSRSSAILERQIDLLQDVRTDLSNHDIIVLVTQGKQNTIANIGYAHMPPNAARELKKKFQPKDSLLTVVLVGKDGLEVGRWNRIIYPEAIIDLIDPSILP
ncbi:DUF4174 domain-containing protein [Candidatus Endowatersipora endosymbiont of Watersipora subatra]|uniref:DUF4174 domain-containing protein n=1 Tax=Candidatus Endowatersipora endosymbiont of Watersipora subatra TaxID=3077946 RepID=UPI00312CC0AC